MSTAELTTIDVDATRRLAERYSEAWKAQDLEAIMSMHAPASAFHLHMHPYVEANTHDAIAQEVAAFFTAMPDMTFETIRLEIRPGLFTHEWSVTATLALPLVIGERVAQPTGQPIRFPGIDVISCEEGLVRRKDCYLDGVGLEHQLFPGT